MTLLIMRGNALDLQMPDSCVDLIVTSPPYFGLRSYQDGGEHYSGQIGAEATPTEFVDALISATREMMRVLKPSGSIWVNLGDKYGKDKSLMDLPHRYAIRCRDELRLIKRAEVIWSKPNGLPESVTDRVRRSHETWFHFTKEPRYYSAVDEIREGYSERVQDRQKYAGRTVNTGAYSTGSGRMDGTAQAGPLGFNGDGGNPLGKLPGSVWTIPTQPLKVPPELGIDHFAAFPMEWPRRIIAGWSPAGVCTACGQGRRPVVKRDAVLTQPLSNAQEWPTIGGRQGARKRAEVTATGGYACGCAEPTAPTTPGVVLDPFGGTGTTALMADVLGRDAISVDLSEDYCRLARWRTADPKERAKAEKKVREAAARPKPKDETPANSIETPEDAS